MEHLALTQLELFDLLGELDFHGGVIVTRPLPARAAERVGAGTRWPRARRLRRSGQGRCPVECTLQQGPQRSAFQARGVAYRFCTAWSAARPSARPVQRMELCAAAAFQTSPCGGTTVCTLACGRPKITLAAWAWTWAW